MTPEISIIVPVFNMEKYLRECLDSIKAQTFTNWECILVDDGSTDASGAICNEYAGHDPRFKAIHRENGGLSAARNSGLEIAKAEFIGFVDADDYLHPQMYENLFRLITEQDADVVQTGYTYIFKSFNREKKFVKEIKILNHTETILGLFDSSKLTNHVCNKLFRREIISSPFPEGLVYEDMYVMSSWARNIHKTILSPTVHYFYRKRKGSITHTITFRNQNNHLTSRFKQIDNLSSLLVTGHYEDQIVYYKWKSMIAVCKYIARNIKDECQALNMITELQANCPQLPKSTIHQLGPKLFIRAECLIEKPAYFVRMMRIVYKFDFHARFEARQLCE